MKATKFTTVEEYFAALPSDTKAIMKEVRKTIKDAAPGAEEVISYNIPAFKLNGMLVWYAAFKAHIGFYPRASGTAKFKKEISGYKNAKGSVQFPIDRPMPLSLITKIVKFRIKENQEAANAKVKPKTKK